MSANLVAKRPSEASMNTSSPATVNSDRVLTLDTLLVSRDALERSPSQSGGLKTTDENALRFRACSLMQNASILLKLPQDTSATAQIIFQCFFYQKSFVTEDYFITSIACMYIAIKVGEQEPRLRDLINVFHFLQSKYTKK